MENQVITPVPQKNGITTILVIVIVLLLISNIVTAYFLLTQEEEKEVNVYDRTTVEQESLDEVEEVTEEMEILIPELQTATIGEEVSLGDYSVTVLQVQDPTEGELSIPAREGYKYVAIEILLENKLDSTVYYYSDWTLYDGEGYDYSTYTRKEPVFSTSGSIPVNGTTKGWLNFRTLEDSTDFTVKFNETRNDYSIEFVFETEEQEEEDVNL